MTTVRITPGLGRIDTPTVRRTFAQQALLACGVLSSLLYIATDVLGGLTYEGYSFTSQAISELMAVGAPSERLVDPLFLIYGLLVVAFGAAVFREGTNLAMRLTGVLLGAYGLIGLSGPTLFEMTQRGTGGPGNDTPHIIVTGLLVLLLLATIGVGGLALGRRFRIYSFITLLAVIAFGVLTIPFAARLAAGQPTPGFGIIERANIYLSLLWIAVLGTALLQHRLPDGKETP